MKPFEIYSCQPPEWPEPHPCVVISHPDRANKKSPVEVLMCASRQATRKPEAHEVILDTADGLDWPTLCKCDLVYSVPRAELKNRRGLVTGPRRQQLLRTLIASHAWAEVLAGAS